MKWLLALVLCAGLTTPVWATPAPSAEELAWCRAHNLVCFTVEEDAEIRKAQIRDAETIRKLKRRTSVNVGLEYLPNDAKTEPYLSGSIGIGPISVWAGAFGSEPAVGINWRF